MGHQKIVLAGALLLLVALAGFSRSIFTDVALSENNEISSGEFDIGISKDGERFYNDLKLFDFSDLKPGDERAVTFYVKNRGDLEVSRITMTLYINDLEDGALPPAEKEVDNTTDRGELSGYLVITGLSVQHGDITTDLAEVVGKTLKELDGKEIELFKGSLGEGEVLKVVMRVRFSPEAGNECQTDRVDVDMKINAEQ
ncbi:methyltransferase [Thermococcus sp. LS1]|uniref:TasA family protein n=1 Tax=Thermococcus sp. LS1 TaxID=1638259 RepID=UPI00143B05B3|nr:TasA family protein [Thermococcus sp. LS1]NJD98862.1 methyltransferase [Thermococcus sp. LS1]